MLFDDVVTFPGKKRTLRLYLIWNLLIHCALLFILYFENRYKIACEKENLTSDLNGIMS